MHKSGCETDIKLKRIICGFAHALAHDHLFHAELASLGVAVDGLDKWHGILAAVFGNLLCSPGKEFPFCLDSSLNCPDIRIGSMYSEPM